MLRAIDSACTSEAGVIPCPVVELLEAPLVRHRQRAGDLLVIEHRPAIKALFSDRRHFLMGPHLSNEFLVIDVPVEARTRSALASALYLMYQILSLYL